MSSSRWLRAVVVIAATAVLLASSCSWRPAIPIPEGVPPPPGDPVPAVNFNSDGRPADQLEEWAATRAPALGIPIKALEAYAYASHVVQVEKPDCHLGWTTLAGIGKVESRHGTYHGAEIEANGDVRPPIRGVRLDGTNGNLEIVDHEATESSGDGDTVYARAMGPMQFIPDTWRLYAVDANHDGMADPDNIDDATLAAAGYLCERGGDMATATGWMNALRAYNHSDRYARAVRDWATAYAEGHSL